MLLSATDDFIKGKNTFAVTSALQYTIKLGKLNKKEINNFPKYFLFLRIHALYNLQVAQCNRNMNLTSSNIF